MTTTLTNIGTSFVLQAKLSLTKLSKTAISMLHTRLRIVIPREVWNSHIFQKINMNVFKNPVDIMKNIDLVTTHIRSKHKDIPTPHFHHTANGNNYLYDADGSFCRAMNCIDSMTFNTCSDAVLIRITGLAFGRFQMQLADFDGSQLFETIVNLERISQRLKYGLPEQTDIFVYELGFNDRYLAQEISKIIGTQYKKKDAKKAIKQNRGRIETLLSDFPLVFQNRLNNL